MPEADKDPGIRLHYFSSFFSSAGAYGAGSRRAQRAAMPFRLPPVPASKISFKRSPDAQ
jgi:hypothetical protein